MLERIIITINLLILHHILCNILVKFVDYPQGFSSICIMIVVYLLYRKEQHGINRQRSKKSNESSGVCS